MKRPDQHCVAARARKRLFQLTFFLILAASVGGSDDAAAASQQRQETQSNPQVRSHRSGGARWPPGGSQQCFWPWRTTAPATHGRCCFTTSLGPGWTRRTAGEVPHGVRDQNRAVLAGTAWAR